MIQRYRFSVLYRCIIEEMNGEFVMYDDYQKLEAELEQLRQQVAATADDGWIEWAGDERPVPVGTLVDVKWSNGDVDSGEEAGEWRWSNWMNGPNIIAYRIIPERATNQNGEQ